MYSLSLNAQTRIVDITKDSIREFKKGTYFKNPGLKKFEGAWVYENNGEVFKITLKTQQKATRDNQFFYDVLQGYYCYSKIGGECNIDTSRASLRLESPINKANTEVVTFFFTDIEKEKKGRAVLKLTENGTATWLLKNRRDVIIKESEKDWDPTFSVPTDIIMTKIE